MGRGGGGGGGRKSKVRSRGDNEASQRAGSPTTHEKNVGAKRDEHFK